MSAQLPLVNTRLAASIKEAACTYSGLARRVNELGAKRGLVLRYDKTSVSHWLSGTQPRSATRYLLAEVLAQKLGRAVTLAELGFTEPESPGCLNAALCFQANAATTIETLTELGHMDLDRRSLLKVVPFVGAALLGPQRDWLLAVAETTAGHPPPLDGMSPAAGAHAMIRVFDEMDNRFGGGHARSAALRYLTEELVPILRQPRQETEQRALFTAAAKLAAMTGWMTYDAGGYGLAQRYMTQALGLCSQGGDHILGGQILAGLSHLATSVGNPQEGLALARTGIATTKQGSPLGLMRLHAMRARAHAALNEPRQAAAALKCAERALDTSPGSASESEWVRFLDSAYLAAEMACCFRDLRDHHNAERFANTAVSGTRALGRRHTISLTVLATARLEGRDSDLEGALSTASTVLHQLDRVSSQRTVAAVNDLRRRLGRYRKEPRVQQFEAEARTRLGAA